MSILKHNFMFYSIFSVNNLFQNASNLIEEWSKYIVSKSRPRPVLHFNLLGQPCLSSGYMTSILCTLEFADADIKCYISLIGLLNF